jgi:predicted CoA-binding protein
MTTKQTIEAFLANPAIAVVGASRSAHKFGNTACRVLLAKGYRVYPIHRQVSQIDGMACYPRLVDLPEKVNAVLIDVPPWEALDVIGQAAAAGIHYVWLQQGAESAEAVKLAATLGLALISSECVLLYAKPTGVHLAHRFIRRITGSLPA